MESLRTFNRDKYESTYETYTPPQPKPGYFKTNHLDHNDLSNIQLGNALDGGQLRHTPCANNHDASIDKVCDKKGTLECGRCHLVRYCSADCQKHDWPHHKETCKGAVARGDYSAFWAQYSGPSSPLDQGPSSSFLVGNTPAFNLMGPGCTNILLAASGDIRNVLETVFALPQDAKLKFVLNDYSPYVAVRNYLMLTLLERFGADAVDMIINLWYSTTLTTQQNYIAKLHAQWLLHKGGKEGSAIHSYIPPELLAANMFATGHPVSAEAARTIPRQRHFNPVTRSYVDAHLSSMDPWHRHVHIRRQLYSTLLPFGAMNTHLNQTNKTLFLEDKFLPPTLAYLSQGWDLHQVDQMQGMPKNDIYGKLYMHIAVRLEKLADCLQNGQVTIDMYMDGAMKLPRILKGQTFDVIDVSYACDDHFCGPTLIPTLAPLLNKSNPKATIVSCFMMWISTQVGKSAYLQKIQQANTKASSYLYKNGHVTDKVDTFTLNTMINKLSQWFVDLEPHFTPYLTKSMKTFSKSIVRPRKVHHIVPKRIQGSMTEYKTHRDPTPLDIFPWNAYNEVFVEWELCP